MATPTRAQQPDRVRRIGGGRSGRAGPRRDVSAEPTTIGLIESDILADGSLDYPDEVLAEFDSVVASVHSRFKLDPKLQTGRIIRAVKNPHTTILGHMTGRQLLRRPGYEIDIESVLAPRAAMA